MSAGVEVKPPQAHWVVYAEIAGGVGLFLLSVVGSAVVAGIMLCRLPADYLLADASPVLVDDRPRWQQLLGRIGRNLLGVLLVILGVLLSLPGVPGQGILTILIGVMLLDVPGKRALERRIICRPTVFRSINRLRTRFGRAPLLPVEMKASGDLGQRP